MDDNILDMTGLSTSSEELLFDNQGSSGDDPGGLQILNDHDVVDGFGASHGFKGLFKGRGRDLADGGQSRETIIESLVKVSDLERTHAIALRELVLDHGRDQVGAEEGQQLGGHVE